MTKKLTLKDIAYKAGVSLTTASMYINGKAEKYKIAKSTCQRLEKIIQDNNFSANMHARAIAGKKTFLIGVILAEQINKSFWLDILSGIEEYISPFKYHMILSVSHRDAEQELETFNFMREKSVDGVIIAPVLSEKNNLAFFRKIKNEIPLVTVAAKIKGLTCVNNDEKKGAEAAAAYLYERGHRKIATIGMKTKQYNRLQIFTEYFLSKKINVENFATAESFISEYRKFTAVFCFSDFHAFDLYNKIADTGVSIPDDISIVGYDDMPLAKQMKPTLTTVHQYKKELGSAAAELVMNMISNKEKRHVSKSFAPFLVQNNSVREN